MCIGGNEHATSSEYAIIRPILATTKTTNTTGLPEFTCSMREFYNSIFWTGAGTSENLSSIYMDAGSIPYDASSIPEVASSTPGHAGSIPVDASTVVAITTSTALFVTNSPEVSK
ncbi:unnamed protein product, partial [Rotaria magnacalcarata]